MKTLMFAASTAFIRSFAVTFLFAVTGILAAPNQDAAVALSWAALVASIVAGLRAVQVFIPQLSFASFVQQPVAAWIDSFARAFLGSLITLLTGWLAAPDWGTWKAGVLSVLIGAVTAGVRAIQGLATPSESPAPGSGLPEPPA